MRPILHPSFVACILLLVPVACYSSNCKYLRLYNRCLYSSFISTVPSCSVLLLKGGYNVHRETLTAHSLMISRNSFSMMNSFDSSDHRYRDGIVKIAKRIVSVISSLKDYQQRKLFLQQVREGIRLVYNSSVAVSYTHLTLPTIYSV